MKDKKKKDTDDDATFAAALGVFDVDDDENTDGGDQGEGNQPQPKQFEFEPGHPYYKPPAKSDDDQEGGPDLSLNQPADKGKTKAEPNKTNPDRFEYWQAQATKAMEMNQKLMAMLEEKTATPPANTPQAEPTPEEQLQTLQGEASALVAPPRPTKPADYSSTDAVTDPDSASFRYRAAMEEYNEAFIDYTQKKADLTEKIYQVKLDIIEKPVKNMTRQQQLSQEQQNTVALLKENYKFTDEQAIDFIQMMSRPDSMKMENLVRFYQVMKGVKSPNGEPPPQKRNRSLLDAAPPMPTGSGAGQDTDDDDEMETSLDFSRGLLS